MRRVAALLLLLCAAEAAAQDRTEIRAANGLSWQEGNETVSFLTGGVVVERSDFSVRAARAMVWTRGGSEQPFDEFYAEGNVIFIRKGKSADDGGQRLRADRFYYDLAGDRGAIVDLRIKAQGKDPSSNFYLTAKEVRMQGGKLVGSHVTLTACDYTVPHFHIALDEGRLQGEQPRDRAKGEFDPWPYQDYSIDLVGLSPEFGGIPFFIFPRISFGSWVSEFPIRSARYGHSSRFGHYVYSDLGTRLKMRDDDGTLRNWGDLRMDLDWREERGGAYGLDLVYGSDGYDGFIDTYYLYDLGRDPSLAFNGKFPPLKHDHRGRAHALHREELGNGWRYELEAHYMPDRSFREEFFEKEFKELKDPETVAFLRWKHGNLMSYLMQRNRLNDFQTQDEYLPRFHLALLSQPLFPGLFDHLYFSERFDAVHIRRRFDKDLHQESVQTYRADALSDLRLALDFRFFQVSPFVQGRTTFYEDDLEGETEIRRSFTAGGRVVSQLHGTFPEVRWEAVGLRGLRHVVEGEARYASTFWVSEDPSEFYLFEELDGLDRFAELAFELRQRFLTKDETGRPREFFSTVAAMEYYPRRERDTTGPNVNNYLDPHNWIPLTADFENRTYRARRWSNVHYQATATPVNLLRVIFWGEYNTESLEEEVRQVEAILAPMPGLSFSLGQTYVKNVTNAYTGGVSWALTPKWKASLLLQYDYRTRDFLKQEFVVSRDFHDFQVEVFWDRDYSRDEDRFLVGVVPKFLGRSGLNRSHIHRIEGVDPPWR